MRVHVDLVCCVCCACVLCVSVVRETVECSDKYLLLEHRAREPRHRVCVHIVQQLSRKVRPVCAREWEAHLSERRITRHGRQLHSGAWCGLEYQRSQEARSDAEYNPALFRRGTGVCVCVCVPMREKDLCRIRDSEENIGGFLALGAGEQCADISINCLTRVSERWEAAHTQHNTTQRA